MTWWRSSRPRRPRFTRSNNCKAASVGGLQNLFVLGKHLLKLFQSRHVNVCGDLQSVGGQQHANIVAVTLWRGGRRRYWPVLDPLVAQFENQQRLNLIIWIYTQNVPFGRHRTFAIVYTLRI
jgi:hypothetical protein